MSNDQPRSKSRDVIDLAAVRRRIEEEKEDAVAPVRLAFIEDLGELIDDYLDAVDDVTGGDPDKALEELMAACATALALAAEEHFEEIVDQAEFIESVAEIATDLLEEDDAQGELFEDDEKR